MKQSTILLDTKNALARDHLLELRSARKIYFFFVLSTNCTFLLPVLTFSCELTPLVRPDSVIFFVKLQPKQKQTNVDRTFCFSNVSDFTTQLLKLFIIETYFRCTNLS